MVQPKEGPLRSAITRLFAEIVEEVPVGREEHPEKFQFVDLADLSAVPVYLSGLQSGAFPPLLHPELFCVTRLLLYKLFKVFLV
jgi:hypothetical protein